MKRALQIVLIGSILLLVAAELHASSLPPKPQAAFDKGMAAAKQQDFTGAVKYFKEACDLVAKDEKQVYPHLYFNRALAESKLAYHELDAIRWFNAYLASAPTAQNAAQVRAEIEALRTKAKATAKVLAEQATSLGVSHKLWFRGDYERAMKALALCGSIQQARQLMKDQQLEQYGCWTAGTLAQYGDEENARSFLAIGVAANITDKEKENCGCCSASWSLFQSKIGEGDIKAAEAYYTSSDYQGMCASKNDQVFREFPLSTLMDEYLKAGKMEDAERWYARWLKETDESTPEIRFRDLAYYYRAWARWGHVDFEGARKTASLISNERYEDPNNKGKWISGKELKEKMAERLKPEAVSEYCAKLAWGRYLEGDTAGVLRYIELMPVGREKERAKYAELETQCQKEPSKCEEIKAAARVMRWAATDKKEDYYTFGSDDLVLDIPSALDAKGKDDYQVYRAVANMSTSINFVLKRIERLEKETGTRMPPKTSKISSLRE